jgi:predicted nuclease of restriction endonuclease-like (RecB) superfamily
LAVRNLNGREFYEVEALRGGWTIRQLNRQIESQFYERSVLSKDKSKLLRRGSAHLPVDVVMAEDEIKDPYFLEFLALKDEYSETDLASALIIKLESFLLELGGDFTFVGRQRRLRVGDAWYRVDLLFFHRLDAQLGMVWPASLKLLTGESRTFEPSIVSQTAPPPRATPDGRPDLTIAVTPLNRAIFPLNVYTASTRAKNGYPVPASESSKMPLFDWSGRQDSNLRPRGPEPRALPD